MEKPAETWEDAVTSMGCYPQAQTLGPNYDSDAPNSVYRIPWDGLPDFEPNFGQFTLEPRAIVTDVLSIPVGTNGVFVSERVRRILEGFELQPHRWFDVPVVQKVLRKPKLPPVTVGTYFYLHLPALLPELPDDKAEAEAQALAMFPTAELLRVRAPSKYNGTYLGAGIKRAMVAEGITGIRFRFARLFR